MYINGHQHRSHNPCICIYIMKYRITSKEINSLTAMMPLKTTNNSLARIVGFFSGYRLFNKGNTKKLNYWFSISRKSNGDIYLPKHLSATALHFYARSSEGPKKPYTFTILLIYHSSVYCLKIILYSPYFCFTADKLSISFPCCEVKACLFVCLFVKAIS